MVKPKKRRSRKRSRQSSRGGPTSKIANLVLKKGLAGEDPIPTREELEKIVLGDLAKWLG